MLSPYLVLYLDHTAGCGVYPGRYPVLNPTRPHNPPLLPLLPPDELVCRLPLTTCSIKAQDEPFETPMQPITMMRNSLGREEGGSGVSLDREAYEASTSYWQTHAAIVAGEEPSGE